MFYIVIQKIYITFYIFEMKYEDILDKENKNFHIGDDTIVCDKGGTTFSKQWD